MVDLVFVERSGGAGGGRSKRPFEVDVEDVEDELDEDEEEDDEEEDDEDEDEEDDDDEEEDELLKLHGLTPPPPSFVVVGCCCLAESVERLLAVLDVVFVVVLGFGIAALSDCNDKKELLRFNGVCRDMICCRGDLRGWNLPCECKKKTVKKPWRT